MVVFIVGLFVGSKVGDMDGSILGDEVGLLVGDTLVGSFVG